MVKIKDFFLPYIALQAMVDHLERKGFRCIAPQVREGAIVYDTLHSVSDLPWGWRDLQKPGGYQLEKTADNKAFGFSNGPQGIKPFLFKPEETTWKVERSAEGKLSFKPFHPKEQPIAYFGARACDIAAMVIQDKVFIDSQYPDERYQRRRDSLFVIAVNCTYASANCFCVSAGSGPECQSHYDIALTEIDEGFVVKIGTERGGDLIRMMNLEVCDASQLVMASNNRHQASVMQTKRIPFDNQRKLRDNVMNALDHPRWAEVAERCLSCGNCTSVCPTCFCHTEVEKPTMDASASEHQTQWDSCFTEGHSYFAGKVLRDTTEKRYRQWLTHKVGTWFDQFDTSGCVGCGRCIAWCPVGIDLTEECSAIAGDSNIRNT